MEAAIEWAQHFIQLSDKDKKIIKEAKKYLIFKEWFKRVVLCLMYAKAAMMMPRPAS
jgi:hypothetical protein